MNRRHRNKTAEYVGSLEAEVARLQHLDAVVNSEKNALAHQNNAIKDFLSKQSIDAYMDSINLDSPHIGIDELSQLGGAALNIRFDTDLEHERIFLDLPDMSEMLWTSTESSADESIPERPARHAPVQVHHTLRVPLLYPVLMLTYCSSQRRGTAGLHWISFWPLSGHAVRT